MSSTEIINSISSCKLKMEINKNTIHENIIGIKKIQLLISFEIFFRNIYQEFNVFKNLSDSQVNEYE